jgi:site-specific recombinase XerD
VQTETPLLAERKPGKKWRNYPRGIFEKMPDSKVWWIRYADAMGRIRREKAGTKGAATDLYRKRKTEALRGKKLPESLRAPRVGFAELAQDALVYSKTHKRTHEDDLNRMPWLLRAFRERTADSITPQDLELHLSRMAEERNWAPASVNRYRALVSLIFRLGIENGKVKENPARLVKHRLVINTRTRWLFPEEEARLRTAIEARHAEHLLELEMALNTGLRLSEMYGMRWENVNVSQRVLTVPRSKNGEMRHVPLNATAVAVLLEFRKRGDGSGQVIRSATGLPLTNPRHWFEAAVRVARIHDFSWHCLRHTFASRLVMAGVDIRTVQELLGHKSITMTVRYSHLSPSHTLAAVERLVCANLGTPTGAKTGTEPIAEIQTGVSYVH